MYTKRFANVKRVSELTFDYFFSLQCFLSANSDNNKHIFDRVIEQVLHDFGGQEKCPWSRNTMEGDGPNTHLDMNIVLFAVRLSIVL